MSTCKKTAPPETDTVKKTQTNEKLRKEMREKKRETFMYLGPDIKGTAKHGQIFQDGISPALAEKIEKIPVLKDLCIPMDEATGKFVELKAGGPASKLYEAAAVQLKAKGDRDE